MRRLFQNDNFSACWLRSAAPLLSELAANMLAMFTVHGWRDTMWKGVRIDLRKQFKSVEAKEDNY